MDQGWIRRTIGLLALIVALALPLIAYADRTERFEPSARDSKHEVREAEPKRADVRADKLVDSILSLASR
jgi:hypothetical protein